MRRSRTYQFFFYLRRKEPWKHAALQTGQRRCPGDRRPMTDRPSTIVTALPLNRQGRAPFLPPTFLPSTIDGIICDVNVTGIDVVAPPVTACVARSQGRRMVPILFDSPCWKTATFIILSTVEVTVSATLAPTMPFKALWITHERNSEVISGSSRCFQSIGDSPAERHGNLNALEWYR